MIYAEIRRIGLLLLVFLLSTPAMIVSATASFRRNHIFLYFGSFFIGISGVIGAAFVFLRMPVRETASNEMANMIVLLASDYPIIPVLLMFAGLSLFSAKLFFRMDTFLFSPLPESQWMPIARAGIVAGILIVISRLTIPFIYNEHWYTMSGPFWDLIPYFESVAMLAAAWYVTRLFWENGIRDWRRALASVLVFDMLMLIIVLPFLIFVVSPDDMTFVRRISLWLQALFSYIVAAHAIVTYTKSIQDKGGIAETPKIIDSELAQRIYRFVRDHPSIPVITGITCGIGSLLWELVFVLRWFVLETNQFEEGARFLLELINLLHWLGIHISVLFLLTGLLLFAIHANIWNQTWPVFSKHS